MQSRIMEINKYGLKAIGRKEIYSHLNGKHLTRGEAILAKCYECNGYYANGKADCKIPVCPLYNFMPYRQDGSDNA